MELLIIFDITTLGCIQCFTFDRQLHSAVHVAQVAVAALHNLVPGRRGLAGQRALLVDLEAAFLVHQGAGADCQR